MRDAGAGHDAGRRRAVGPKAVGLFLVDLSVIDETGIGRQFRELLVLFLSFVDPAAEVRALFAVPGRIRLEFRDVEVEHVERVVEEVHVVKGVADLREDGPPEPVEAGPVEPGDLPVADADAGAAHERVERPGRDRVLRGRGRRLVRRLRQPLDIEVDEFRVRPVRAGLQFQFSETAVAVVGEELFFLCPVGVAVHSLRPCGLRQSVHRLRRLHAGEVRKVRQLFTVLLPRQSGEQERVHVVHERDVPAGDDVVLEAVVFPKEAPDFLRALRAGEPVEFLLEVVRVGLIELGQLVHLPRRDLQVVEDGLQHDGLRADRDFQVRVHRLVRDAEHLLPDGDEPV